MKNFEAHMDSMVRVPVHAASGEFLGFVGPKSCSCYINTRGGDGPSIPRPTGSDPWVARQHALWHASHSVV